MSLTNVLDNMLDTGWTPSTDERIQNTLSFLRSIPTSESIPALENLITKYQEELELQTNNSSGSGCQEEVIQVHRMAYYATMGVLNRIKTAEPS